MYVNSRGVLRRQKKILIYMLNSYLFNYGALLACVPHFVTKFFSFWRHVNSSSSCDDWLLS